jgi:glycosyltransferase involved in cell wall biosynthesis
LLDEPLYVTELKKVGVPYIVADISKYNVVKNVLLFRRIFREHAIDAVYVHFGFERYWATLFGKLFGKITIWNEHWHSLGTTYVLFKRLFYRLFVDQFISISSFITHTLPRGARVFTIRNSIRAGTPSPRGQGKQRESLRRRLGLDSDATIILMVAAFTTQKRHVLALEICNEILAQYRNVQFVFLGEGPERDNIRRRLQESGIERRFAMPGHVENVDDYYDACDVCMFTGYNDGFGYTVLEAMTHSLPVIAFASGGPAEIIRDGESGVLIEENDVAGFARQLGELIENRESRLKMGEKARQMVEEEFSRDAWIHGILRTLREILQTSPP